MPVPLKVFCCYAREDQELLEHLKRHLMSLQRSGQITIWSDTNLNAGIEWEKELRKHLESADIILLLISPDFMASDYCYSIEMKRAIERHDQGIAHVFPVLLRPVHWDNAPFAKLQIIPTNARPVTSKEWGSKDEAFLDIAEGIQKVVVTLLAKEKQRCLDEEMKRARQEQEQTEKLETEMARSSKLPPLIVKRVTRSSSRRIVLVGLAGLVIVALIRGVVWFPAHQTPLTRGIQAPLAGRITSGANATTTVQATSGIPGKTTTVQATSGIPGKTWQTQNAGNFSTPQHLYGVAWSGSQFVVVGSTDELKTIILTSPDGYTWTAQNAGILDDFSLGNVAWLGSRFVVVGDNGAILTSPDGHTWTAQNSDTSYSLSKVAWSGTQFIVVGGNGTILTSPDGQTWTAHFSGTTLSLIGVAWSGTRFVVVGDHGIILTSPDGRTWTAQNSGTSDPLEGVTWSGTQFVVVGFDAILTSPDGRTWTAQNPSTLNSFVSAADVAWLGTQFVIVGSDGAILTSPDGRTWTAQNSGTENSLEGVAWSGTRFVVVGNNSTILTSP